MGKRMEERGPEERAEREEVRPVFSQRDTTLIRSCQVLK